MNIINKQVESHKSRQLIETPQEIMKLGNFRFNIDSNMSRKVWLPRRRDKRGGNKVAAIDLALLFRNNERKRWDRGYFEINDLRATTSTERNRQESTQNVSSTEESKMARPTIIFPLGKLNDYDNAQKKIHYIQVNHLTDKQKFVNAAVEQDLKKAAFSSMVDLKTLIYKTSIDPKLLQLKNCLPKGSSPQRFSEFFTKLTIRFGLLFVGDKKCTTREVKKQ